MNLAYPLHQVENMRPRLFLAFSIPMILIIVLHAFVGNASASKALSAIQMCLPKPDVGTYQYSIADYADRKPSRWLLVRAIDKPYLAPSYSVVEVKGGTCKNHHKYPVVDLTRSSSIPRQIVSKFMARINADLVIANKMFENQTRKQYPGKSRAQLQQMGVYGMDAL
jgi:hypothetical protein